MDVAPVLGILVSAVLFVGYGLLCLFSDGMLAEFERYGLSRFRRVTGALEVLGGAGLLVGYFVPEVLLVASGGLALLMLLGLIARFRVRDSFFESLPASILLVVNGFLFAYALGMLRSP
jgi:hypothetical protein